VRVGLVVLALVVIVVVVVVVVVLVVPRNGVKGETGAAQVTPRKYAQIRVGMSRREVERLLGSPESANSAMLNGQLQQCVYYEVLAESGTYQFCFADGGLDSKHKY
jgi:hypothetical protein